MKPLNVVISSFVILISSLSAEPIDLPTVLRLAGAENLDVRLAHERLAEARADHESARLKFFPWVSPGIGYRRHEGRIQDVVGTLIDTTKQQYTPAIALNLQLDLGEAIYQNLAAKLLVRAATHAAEAEKQKSIAQAAAAYFDLALSRAKAGVAAQAMQLSGEYEKQLTRALETGLAKKGDVLRVRVQTGRNEQAKKQAEEDERLASTRLAELLHLDPAIQLRATESDLVPLSLTQASSQPADLVARAKQQRPEIQHAQALVAAAEQNRKGAVYGPMVPSIIAQASAGGIGGGVGSTTGGFGGNQDYFIGLGWRIGPGGLFDRSRKHKAESQLRSAELTTEQTRTAISREVTDALTRLQSQRAQTALTRRTLETAEEALKLAEERKEFGIAAVLERITAEQDLTQARRDYLEAIARQNTAQYELRRAVGQDRR